MGYIIGTMVFIGYKLNGDCSRETLNDEIARVSIMKCVLDFFCFQWVYQLGCLIIKYSLISCAGFWFFMIFDTVWWSDTGAMLLGIRFGKHKFSYWISPNKTWEGFLGQFFGCFLAW